MELSILKHQQAEIEKSFPWLYYQNCLSPIITFRSLCLCLQLTPSRIPTPRILWTTNTSSLFIPHFSHSSFIHIFKKLSQGPVLWRSGLSRLLRCQHPMWVPVWFPAALLRIQLPANAPRKTVENSPSVWPLHPHRGLGESSWLLAPVWPGSGHCGHFGGEPMDRRSFFVFAAISPSILVSLRS